MNAAGIYEWRIDGAGVYIGKAKCLRKRIRAYPNNVRRMMNGRPWHGNHAKDYRPIHHALRQAYVSNAVVSVAVLEVCDPAERAARERFWIAMRVQEHLSGGPCVLNVI